jgi:hypothetical protein
MELKFKTHREYLQENPDFPNNYWISIAKKHSFLIWIKNPARKQPPLFLEESMNRLLEFVRYQDNWDSSDRRVARPSDLQRYFVGRQIPFTPEELGSFARLGILKSCFDKVRKTGWTGIYILTNSYNAFADFHLECQNSLVHLRRIFPQIDFNPTK